MAFSEHVPNAASNLDTAWMTKSSCSGAEFFAGIGLVRKAIEPLGWEFAFG